MSAPAMSYSSTNAEQSAALPKRGLLLVVSGPSGSGKSTLVQQILKEQEFPIRFSVSATSRAPRPGEVDGQHYRFLANDEFVEQAKRGEFLEYAEVHGHYYGTPRGPVEEILADGGWVLLEIDVQGHRQVKERKPDAVSFFLRTPGMDEYEERLKNRGTETPEVIARRVAQARAELAAAADYDFQVVNETIEQAVRTFRTLLWGVVSQRGTSHAR